MFKLEDIEYNVPIEVTRNQYEYFIIEFAGIVTHRYSSGKFWIKVWNMTYKTHVCNALNKIK